MNKKKILSIKKQKCVRLGIFEPTSYFSAADCPTIFPTFISVAPLPTAASPPTVSGLQAKQSSVVHYSAVQCSTVQCITVQYSAVQCSTMQCNGWHGNTVKYNAVYYSAGQFESLRKGQSLFWYCHGQNTSLVKRTIVDKGNTSW